MGINTQHKDRWLRKKEVLQRIGISPNTLKKLVVNKEIHAIILAPNCHRYSEAEVKIFMDRKMNEIAAKRASAFRDANVQDEEMDRLYGCEWQVEIPKYK